VISAHEWVIIHCSREHVLAGSAHGRVQQPQVRHEEDCGDGKRGNDLETVQHVQEADPVREQLPRLQRLDL
jgi:hypothetical protein